MEKIYRNEFCELVAQMRDTQREYFRTRDKNVLVKAKELERRVDAFIKNYQKANEQ